MDAAGVTSKPMKMLLTTALVSVAAIASSLAAVPVASAVTAVQLSSGMPHTCALTSSAAAICWGYDRFGEAHVPKNLGQAIDINTRNDHTCAVSKAGKVRCWGRNISGVLGVPPAIH